MRRILLLVVCFTLGVGRPAPVSAQSTDPSDLFLNAYMAVQQGERLEHDGSGKQALSKYRYAASLLEQIQQRYPTWQPLIVEYRKKRTSEHIAALEQQTPTGPGPAVEAEPPLPERDAQMTPPARTGDLNGDVKGRLDALQTELRDSKAQLRAVQQQKEQIAAQLDEAIKQLDKNKTGNAELKARLQQTQEAYKNATSDNPEARQLMQAQIAQLQEQLANEQADREAADEINDDFARRLAKVRTTAKTVGQEREAAEARVKDLEVKYANAAKTTKQLEDAKNEIARLTEQNQSSQLSSNEAAKKLIEAQQQLATLARDRDAARKQADDLKTQVEDAQKQIAAVGAERDTIAKQRDQALSELAKAKDAQKRVDKLIADNSALAQKLADAEKQIKTLNSDSPKKDEEIANLRKEVGETKALLVATQKQSAEYQTSLAGLQKQLDKANSEIAAMQASNATGAEKKKFAEENDLLRGIVLRQLKEQARREQAKKLVLGELKRLEVQSGTLLQEIDYLGQPVVKLTDEEKAMFKQPQIEIAETDSSSSMEFSIAAPKPDEATAVPKPIPNGSPKAPPSKAAVSPQPSATEVAKLTSPAPAVSKSSPIPSPSAPAAGTTASPVPAVETAPNPNVPAALLTQAHDAKDVFERGQYRDAEKIYERMLTQAPNNVYILSNLGVVEFRQNKMKLAEEKFKKAIAIAPEDSFSHRTLGIVYYQQGKYDEAVQSLTKAVALNSKDAIAHNYLGITASQKSWQEAALKELETAIALDPSYADANFNLAVIYATMKPPNKELAQKYYKRAIELGAEPDAALEQLIK
ncbi:MAG: hypothetical protein QOD99_2127 [Chthoniobacter sp.]|nr:hypothetical protein [Chthoniobacter sp.]